MKPSQPKMPASSGQPSNREQRRAEARLRGSTRPAERKGFRPGKHAQAAGSVGQARKALEPTGPSSERSAAAKEVARGELASVSAAVRQSPAQFSVGLASALGAFALLMLGNADSTWLLYLLPFLAFLGVVLLSRFSWLPSILLGLLAMGAGIAAPSPKGFVVLAVFSGVGVIARAGWGIRLKG